MHDQRSGGREPWLPDEDEVASIILDLVRRRYPALVATDELVRELAHPSLMQPIAEPAIYDGLVELTTSGLVHRLDGFVFASRTAIRAAELTA